MMNVHYREFVFWFRTHRPIFTSSVKSKDLIYLGLYKTCVSETNLYVYYTCIKDLFLLYYAFSFFKKECFMVKDACFEYSYGIETVWSFTGFSCPT